MTTVMVKDKYIETLSVLGDVQAAVDLALQRYTIEQITAKLTELRQREAKYQAKYKMDYPTFLQRVASDEDFVRELETGVSTTWEIDLADWEFSYKGVQDWTQRLQELLLE